ncbi:hypothetical protein [Rhizobium ruizarguesonis]|uniref:hypothetical protein n=1 Tax=Rhizobium ruizarguesonis TaxID=2081791 RepID=UPI00102F4682|nr:hypothetical protein [Rhizobium ruizarguesonis]NEJ98636.1 hypothetical protein [Rhizobium ruizarguesonis]TAW62863.1 hypothetical protein ELI16_31915 [Rhizobium ruizarguesonis]TAW92573.1 hypothetical protein ELI11_04385 [Rhizobium ruizarguesonis]
MPDTSNRTTESELAEAVLSILAMRKSGQGSFEDLFRIIPKVISLTPEDDETSPSRPTEHSWQQRVRNITSHKGAEGNYISGGFLKEIGGGLEITGAGRARAKPVTKV